MPWEVRFLLDVCVGQPQGDHHGRNAACLSKPLDAVKPPAKIFRTPVQ